LFSLVSNLNKNWRVSFYDMMLWFFLCMLYLSQLFNFGALHTDDAPCQTLMDQQAKLAVKISAVVMLVLEEVKKKKKEKKKEKEKKKKEKEKKKKKKKK